jgi:vancomycin resistance protein YoaR
VIKGNETKPEYGGGLCQIGTTVFRGALASGLDITARRNHSYRVSYYEPAGTDATIYDPWPDLKFKNDTGKHILIQTRIDGRKIYFDFWGTKDGRQVSMTEPVVYNIVPPPEKKVIKTLDLPVGEIKCTERAHNGADAKFDYTVWYPEDDEPVSTTFHSHYIPWQEVCLLGVTEEEFAAEQASSTPEESE